jgi:hypothetical protein
MLRTLNLIVVFMAAFAASTTTWAQTFDINLSDTSAQFKYSTRIGNPNEGRSELGFGFLYNDDDNYMGEAGLLIVDVAGTKTPGLEVGVGPKLFAARDDSTSGDAVSIGIGGQLRYKLANLSRVNFTLAGYYAPGIVSFADAKNMYEVNGQVGYEILPTANVYVGYRHIEVNFDPIGKETIDETWMVGMKFSY